jgi:hypothetical protein
MLAFKIVEGGLGLVERGLGLLEREPERYRIDSNSTSPSLTRWPSLTTTFSILPEISGVIRTFCAPT